MSNNEVYYLGNTINMVINKPFPEFLPKLINKSTYNFIDGDVILDNVANQFIMKNKEFINLNTIKYN